MNSDSALEAILMIIIEKYPEYLDNEIRLLSLFADLAPYMIRERKIIHSFLVCGGMRELYPLSIAFESAEQLNLKIENIVNSMFQKECIDRQSAMDFVNSWISVVRIKPDERDVSNSFFAVQEAAGNGDDIAQNLLGEFYRDGIGTEKNDELACYWFFKSAYNGNPKAQYNLSMCYRCGIGIQRNIGEAKKWLNSSAQNGCPDALATLDSRIEEEMDLIQNIKKAAENGEVKAQLLLGTMYEDGNGIKRDLIAAASWFKLAAQQGNPEAEYKYALCLIYGKGVLRDFNSGIKWLVSSSINGNEKATLLLKMLSKSKKLPGID